MNSFYEEQGLPSFANPRNAAAGTLRIKNTALVARRNLEVFLYHVSYATNIQHQPIATGQTIAGQKPVHNGNQQPLTHSGMLDMLWELGFRSPKKEMKVIRGIHGVIKHVEEFEAKRDGLPYEIDGMVIKVNDLALQEKLGMTSHQHRRYLGHRRYRTCAPHLKLNPN